MAILKVVRFWLFCILSCQLKNGLCYFTIHDPTIHGPTMHNSCINYPNYLKLCRKNCATGKPNLAEQNPELFLYENNYFSLTSRGI